MLLLISDISAEYRQSRHEYYTRSSSEAQAPNQATGDRPFYVVLENLGYVKRNYRSTSPRLAEAISAVRAARTWFDSGPTHDLDNLPRSSEKGFYSETRNPENP